MLMVVSAKSLLVSVCWVASHLFWHLPHALHTAEQVAAPQHDAAAVMMVPAPGNARRGKESKAPIARQEERR